MRRRKRITVFHFLSNFIKASSSFHRGGWGLWQADEMTHLYIWDDSNKDHQSHYACLLDLNLFVFTIQWKRFQGIKSIISPPHFDFSFCFIFAITLNQLDRRLSSYHCSGHLLLRQFVICGRVNTPARQKYLWSLAALGERKKNVEATLKVLKFWIGLFSFDLLLTFAFTLMTAHDEM